MFSRITGYAYVFVALSAFAAAMPGGGGGGGGYPTTYTTTSQGHTLTVTTVVTASTTVTQPVTTTVVVTQPVTTTKPAPTTVTVTSPPSSTQVPASQCNAGDLQCCNSVQAASSGPVGLLLGLLGVVLSDLSVLVGITCTPISVIGIGGNSCNEQVVCCQNNSFNGLIAVGCTPVNINL